MYNILVGDIDNAGGYAYGVGGAEGIWDISVPSSQFCWESKTAV